MILIPLRVDHLVSRNKDERVNVYQVADPRHNRETDEDPAPRRVLMIVMLMKLDIALVIGVASSHRCRTVGNTVASRR